MRGNPCPGAGGRAGRGPFGGLDTKELAEVVVFRLNGFSLQVRWRWQWWGTMKQRYWTKNLRKAPGFKRISKMWKFVMKSDTHPCFLHCPITYQWNIFDTKKQLHFSANFKAVKSVITGQNFSESQQTKVNYTSSLSHCININCIKTCQTCVIVPLSKLLIE